MAPHEGFMQQFHNLVLADPEARCRAAHAIRRSLVSAQANGGKEKGEENLQYSLRRLVRGVQSSRQCARQGFSLALSEVLAAFPDELPGVVQLVKKETELQAGLKASEQKERMLGRLFAYTSILEAGCFRRLDEAKVAKSKHSVVVDMGSGLHEIFSARPYLKDPAAHLLAKACLDLAAAGLAGLVPEAVRPWALEEKLKEGDEALDMHAAGLVLELRKAYLEAQEAGASPEDLKRWPACVKEDRMARPAASQRLARSLGGTLGANPIGDAMPFALAPVCRYWLRSGDCKSVLSKIWPCLDEALFPERSSPAAEAQGLRALSELAGQLTDAAASGGPQNAEVALSGLFGQMPRGLALLLRMLGNTRMQAHAAAVKAQRRLLEAAGAPPLQSHAGGAKGKDKKNKNASKSAEQPAAASAVRLGDTARLAILEALQRHSQYGKMAGQFQRQWQQALLAPLSPSGVRSRCEALMAAAASPGGKSPDANVWPAQLEALALHAKAPDEVVLASVCRLLTTGYFEPSADAAAGGCYSMRAFLSSAGFSPSSSSTGNDMLIPAGSKDKDEGGGSDPKKFWRAKLWSSLVGLVKRPSPEMAEKILAASGNVSDAEGDEEAKGQPVRTYAFNGCLSDGSLLLMRLHQWWDHVIENGPEAGVNSPKSSPKKRKKEAAAGGAALRCVVPLEEEDLALRKRCVETSQALLAEPEADGGMTARQRNALCSLPLALSLVLLGIEDQEEREQLREQINEVAPVLSELPEAPADAPPKKRARVERQRAEALAAVPRVAAELFVNTNSGGQLVKEVTRMAWRELGDYTSDETISGICASVRESGGAESDGEGDEDKDDEEEDDEGALERAEAKKGAKAKRVERLAQLADEAKAEGEADKAAARESGEAKDGEGAGDGSDDADEIVLGGDDLLGQLLGEDEGDEGGSLLSMFAGGGLEGAQPQEPRLSKRQQRLQQRQEDLTHKFRELELVELYLARFVGKRSVCLKIMLDLYEAMIAAAARARGGRAESDPKKKKKGKLDSALKHLEDQLSQRISKLLARALKQVCKPAAVREISAWRSADEWAEHAKKLFALGEAPQTVAAGQRPLAIGSQLLYLLCAGHRAASLGDAAASADASKGWELAVEISTSALKDWGSKKDCEGWCESVLGAFANRTPEVLLRLPWLEVTRANKKVFAQRMQVGFISERLLRNLPPEVSSSPAASALAASFSELCTDLLEATLVEPAKGDAKERAASESGDAKETSQSQRAKLRISALRGISSALKAQKRDGAAALDTKRLASVATKVRDSLPSKRGECHQLCWHVLRSCSKPAQGSPAHKREGQDKGGDQPSSAKKRRKDA